jgi:phage gpG-like protein
MMSKEKTIIKRILNDIRVDLSDEFDQNFEREAFFSEAWERHRSPLRPGGHILVDTGTLRRSVRSEMKETSIRFFTDLPYADIHNEGGEIVVKKRMLVSFISLLTLLLSVPVSTRICPPGRRGLLCRSHASLKNASRSKFWSNSSLRSTRMSFRILLKIVFSLLIIPKIKIRLSVCWNLIL